MENMKFLSKKRKIITVLQLDTKWLKVIQVDYAQESKKVLKIVTKKIDSFSDAEIQDVIKELSRKLKIDPRYFILAIPRYLVATKTLDLPSTNPHEISEMVAIQVEKQILFTAEEMVKDYQIVESRADGYSRVSLIVVQHSIIEKYLKLLQNAAIVTEKVTISSEGLVNWLNLNCENKFLPDKCNIVIDIDYDTCDFLMIFNSKLLFSKNIPIGYTQLLDNREEWHRKFIEDVNRHICSCHVEGINIDNEKVIISVIKKRMGMLDRELLEKEIGLPVEIVDQFENTPLAAKILETYEDIANEGLSFAGLIGLAFGFGMTKFNFIPQEILMERSFKERSRDLYLTGIFLVAIITIISVIFLGKIYNKERCLIQLNQKLYEVNPEVKKLSSMIQVIDLAKERNQIKGITLNLLYEVYRLTSPEIYFDSVRFDSKEKVILKGTSNVISEIFNLVNKLEESEYFQDVKTRNVTKYKTKNGKLTNFEIVCLLEDKYKNLNKSGL